MIVEAVRWGLAGAIAAFGLWLLANDNDVGWGALLVALVIAP